MERDRTSGSSELASAASPRPSGLESGRPSTSTLVDRHNYHSFSTAARTRVATAGLNAADVGWPPCVRGVPAPASAPCSARRRSVGVDWDARALLLRDESPLAFDHLIIAAGSSTNYFGVPGAAEYGFPLYGLEDAVRVRNHLLSLFEAAEAAVPEPARRRRPEPDHRGRWAHRGRGGGRGGRAGRQGVAPGLPRPRRAARPARSSSSRAAHLLSAVQRRTVGRYARKVLGARGVRSSAHSSTAVTLRSRPPTT